MRFRYSTPAKFLHYYAGTAEQRPPQDSVVGIFSSPNSYSRLMTAYFMEYAEDGSVFRTYWNPKSI